MVIFVQKKKVNTKIKLIYWGCTIIVKLINYWPNNGKSELVVNAGSEYSFSRDEVIFLFLLFIRIIHTNVRNIQPFL